MTIYLDIVLIENLCMNYIILFATGYILKVKRKLIWLGLSSLLGAIYAILGYMQVLEIYSNVWMKTLLSIVMIYLAYHPPNLKALVKEWLLFYLVSFVFGGCALALLYFVKPQEILMKNGNYVGIYPLKILVLCGAVAFTLTVITFKLVKWNKKSMYCQISIFFQEESVTTKAIIDTGNMLKDPITRMPVIVVEKTILKSILPDVILEHLEDMIGGEMPKEVYQEENISYIKKIRLIPFRSLGKENGMLLGIKADKIKFIKEERVEEKKDVIIGIYNHKLSKKEDYFALVGLDLLEGSEEDEFTTNVSR